MIHTRSMHAMCMFEPFQEPSSDSSSLISPVVIHVDSLSESIIWQSRSTVVHSIAIPELLQLIASFLSRSDATRFAQSSRLCFYAAMGHIWYSVPNPCYLLALLPKVSFAESDKYRTTYVRFFLDILKIEPD